ncbi:MAG TPA: hypothetical protein P5116_07475 [Eubacteriales bacterium]|jgi:hypothetical protein|nr:hypothetical protein [Clostridia bacterium]HRV73696.1 hypothetical protein [Eubacteriales bacterium]
MITIFNRALVFMDSSAEALAAAKQAMKTAKLEYEVNTKRSRGAFGMRLDSTAYSKFQIAATDNPQHYDYIYYLYCRRKDYTAARAAVSNGPMVR